MRTFAQMLKEIMEERGPRAVDLYRGSDVLSQQYISKLLNGEFTEPLSTLWP